MIHRQMSCSVSYKRFRISVQKTWFNKLHRGFLEELSINEISWGYTYTNTLGDISTQISQKWQYMAKKILKTYMGLGEGGNLVI